MSLQIQMIGTGSAFAKKYYNNNALVIVNGFTLLIDCGYTASKALTELGIPFNQIDGILITHIHADHVGGLEEFAFQYMYIFKHRAKLFIPDSLENALWERTLRGGLENESEGMVCLNDYFDVVIMPEQTPVVIHPGLTVEMLPTEHVPGKPSYSLLLNQTVFYSSDTKFNGSRLRDLHEQRGCKRILHDCQLTGPSTVHALLDELLTLPEEVQNKVLLMHYGDNMPQFVGKTGHMTFMEQSKVYDL